MKTILLALLIPISAFGQTRDTVEIYYFPLSSTYDSTLGAPTDTLVAMSVLVADSVPDYLATTFEMHSLGGMKWFTSVERRDSSGTMIGAFPVIMLPPEWDPQDVDRSGTVDVTDLAKLISLMFLGGK